MEYKKINKILKEHRKWLCDMGGARANLTNADLAGVNLIRANLTDADLTGADLTGANLINTDLTNADLTDVDLTGANLIRANLTRADLAGADLTNADLTDTVLTGTNLINANLTGAKNMDYPINCPEIGEFISFKKLNDGEIATLKIPASAKRSSATNRKCRASEAFVVSIEKDGKQLKSGKSYRGGEYIVGETTYPNSFDENRWHECSDGIHFFITRKEAEKY